MRERLDNDDCEIEKETEQHVSRQRGNTLNVPSTAQDILCIWTERDRFALEVLMFVDGVPNNYSYYGKLHGDLRFCMQPWVSA
jgi:hypothetical protein